MLADVARGQGHRRVYRLATIDEQDQLLQQLNLDERGINELGELLTLGPGRLQEFCDAPFRSKPRLRRHPTRFSDGSFSVFYSSLEAETAAAEVRHWLPDRFGQLSTRRTMYYHRFSCVFAGSEKDLRGRETEWPELVGNDYAFCNQIGEEARQEGLDGLVTPSARHTGTNQPVLQRSALSEPRHEGIVSMTYDPDTGSVVASDEGA